MPSDPRPEAVNQDEGALDDAALEVSGGGALQGSAQPAPLFKRDKAWAQEGVDHTAGLMGAHSAGLPDGATNGLHAGASAHGANAAAYGGAGTSHSFQGPGGLTADVGANAYAGAHAGPTGFGAGAGGESSVTIHVNNNLSIGTRVYAGGQVNAGVGPRGLNAVGEVAAGQESHIDAGVKGHLTGGLSGGTNTHVEFGVKAEAGGRASVGLENKAGASAFAGDYGSVAQSGTLSAGGVKVEGEAGVITPGSAGAGMHIGGGLENGNIKLNIGGSVSALLGGVKLDGTVTVPTKPIVDAAKTEGEAWKWAGENTAKGVVIGANHTADAARFFGSHVTDAGRQVGGAFQSFGEHTADVGKQIGGGFQSMGEHTADVGKQIGSGFQSAGEHIGGGFKDAGNAVDSVFHFSSW